MMKRHLPELKVYYKNISKAMVCKSKIKRAFIKDLRERVNEFLEENKDANIEDVIRQFGQPEEIASTFLETYSVKDIKNAINVRRIVVIGCIAIILMLAAYLVMSYIEGSNSSSGYVMEGTTYHFKKES